MELVALFGIGLVALVVVWLLIAGVRFIWRIFTIDWLGTQWDDPTSPYYHDKYGRGDGHRRY
jgi:hypothetical protein